MATATAAQPRRALVEIQPKIDAGIRRSYLDILNTRSPPSPPPRVPNTSPSNTRLTKSLDFTIDSEWSGNANQRRNTDEIQEPMSERQLVQLIRSLVLVEQSREPRPQTTALKCLQDDLQLRKTNVYKSIPYSRFGSNRDAHCYRKAYPHLVAFKVACQVWIQVILQKKEWDAVLEHTLTVWHYISKLPQWDIASHNTLRDECYAIMAAHSLTALQNYCPTQRRRQELLRRMKTAQHNNQSIVPCIHQLQRIMGCDDDLN
ncbi:uncharacterized protein LOC144074268 [Stigmatopora argus]